MERQQELKVLLKRWEAEFLRERRRKPSQADIDEAPEETRELYREYKVLKKLGKASEPSGKTRPRDGPGQEKAEDSGFWGSHLNRTPKIPGKLGSRSPRAGISAEFYGMKLKAKLGTTGKEPPRTPNPKKTPKTPESPKNPEAEPETSVTQNEENPENPEIPEKFPDFPPDFPRIPAKFRRLKEKVAETLGSLDPAWLRRCQESPEKREFPKKIPEIREFPAGSSEEKVGKEEKVGNSRRKRPREGEAAAEAPAKLGKDFQGIFGIRENPGIFGIRENPGILGMREIREEDEEQLEFPNGGGEATESSGKVAEKEGKAKAKRKIRAPPQNGGNFVRLNLKRKTYSRGSLRGKFLRKQVWKQKWRKKFGVGNDVCFRCGGKGHWASQCTGKDLGSFSEKIPEEEEEELPTLEEVARRTNSGFIPEIPGASSDAENPRLPPNSLDFPQAEFSPPSPPPPPVDPLYPPNPDGTIPDPPEEVLEALRILGYESFRPGQAEAVMRVLSGISTLVILSTGTGKSLCYQLPAFLYHRNSGSICLVISPLLSLMDDQVCGLPSALKAVCIHSNLSQSQRETAVKKVKSGQAQILLISPEFLVGAAVFSRFFRDLPPVAFACLDEVHCVSQWSHNFRPAYLRVCKVLRERLGVRCLLGLTATATAATARDLARNLGIRPENGIGIREFAIPENLNLSVSLESDRDQALLELLGTGALRSAPSVLVYCCRREDSERLAELIEQRLPPAPRAEKGGKKARKGKTSEFRVAAAYHAGLSARERRKIQKDFMADRIRVLCATVAFGMGLDKADVRGIVHYNVPGSLEGYVQEIGRAGRDGNPARCHLFLDPEGQDLLELRRHIHENSVDFFTVKTLVQKVFPPCKCWEKHGKTPENSQETSEFRENSRICRGHRRSVPVQELVETLDLREEGVETLLCVLELLPGSLLELFPSVPARGRIRIPGNFPLRRLWDVAKDCRPLRLLLAQKFPSGIPETPENSGIFPKTSGIPGNFPGISGISPKIPGIFPGISLEFDAVALSDALGWEFPRLRNCLQKAGRILGLRVEFRDLSFHFRSRGDLGDSGGDSVARRLLGRALARENSELRRLRSCCQTFHSVVGAGPEQGRRLRERIREFFLREEPEPEMEPEPEVEQPQLEPEEEAEARARIRELLAAYPDERFSGRAVARIFHGIGSPRFPGRILGRDRRFWRRLLGREFRSLSRLAAQEILAWR